MTDWERYRKCTTCSAPTGSACFAISGTVAGGRPDEVAHRLSIPHMMRKLRTRR